MAVFIGTAGADTYAGTIAVDTISGLGGNDSLFGDAGNDVIEGGAGSDTIDGGSATDTASYAGAAAGVSVNMLTGVHTGDAAGDVITNIESFRGSAFNDTFTSSAAAENFAGLAGNDVYILNTAGDAVFENASEGTDEVQTSLTSFTLATNVENLTYTGASGFTGTGNASNNVITGNSGNDTLNGGAGADTFSGLGGTDKVTYSGTAFGVSINLATGVHTGDALGDVFSSIEIIEGGNGANTLIGDASSNNLRGGIASSNDVLEGGAGADTLDGGGGAADVASYAGAAAGVSVNMLTGVHTGDAAGDVITNIESFRGSAFNDTFTSSAAAENFAGLAGNDVYILNTAGDAVFENASEGTDEVQTSLTSFTLATNVENLTYTGASGFTGTGNASNNVITGNSGNDTLNGGAGADTFSGLGGTDKVTYSGTAFGVSINLATGVHTGDALGDVFSSIEIIEGGNGANTLIGDASSNNLRGGIASSNDVLEGGAGADTLDGGGGAADVASYAGAAAGVSVNMLTGVHTGDAAGDVITNIESFRGSAFNDTFTSSAAAENFAGLAGNDVYILNTAGDAVFENASEGTDEVQTSLTSFTLATNVENLTYTGASGFTGTGNASNNVITGNSGNDTLNGGAGADTFSGLGGTDKVTYSGNVAGVSINLATGVHTGDALGDVFSSIEIIEGGNGADTIVGDASSNYLNGGVAGNNDVLEGGAGADTLDGAGGSGDIASYAGAAAAVNLNLLTGVYTGDASGDVFSNIEAYRGSAFNDTFVSSASSETFQGGAGDDLYVLNAGTDAVAEAASEGTDTVQTNVAVYILGANVENVTYTGASDFSGTGNALDNAFVGAGGNDTFVGGAGADTFSGNGGTDKVTFAGSLAGVSVNLASGVHTGEALGDTFSSVEIIDGSQFSDTLIGNSSANSLYGGVATINDWLEGGAGGDTLDGGAGTGDIVSYAGAAAGVSVNLTTGAHTGDALGDVISNIEIVAGSAFADSLTGGSGNDVLLGGVGGDNLDGGAGSRDAAWYVTSPTGVFVDLLSGTIVGGDAQGDTISNIEDLFGSSFNDTLGGDANGNIIEGRAGSDYIAGDDGDDTIFGGSASGTSLFSIPNNTSSSDADTIEGQNGNDSITISQTGSWTILGGDGMDTIRVAGGGVADSGNDSDRVLFGGLGNTTLYDTGGAADAIVFTNVSNWSSLVWGPSSINPDDLVIYTANDAADGTIEGGIVVVGYYTGSNHFESIAGSDLSFVAI